MAPELVELGLDKMAVHLFIIYYPMLSSITPPSALAAFVAAGIAGAKPIKTAMVAMKLGIVIYFIPLFFVFQPALIMQGSPAEIIYYTLMCAIGILVISGGLEGYFYKIGVIKHWLIRLLFIIVGFSIAFPTTLTGILGIIAFIGVFISVLFLRKKMKLHQ